MTNTKLIKGPKMIYQILNGDSLAYSFPDTKIEGEIIAFRESLIEGDLSGDGLKGFWKTRANFLQVSEVEYRKNVVFEIEKILSAPDDSEFNLWFEYDLFCQVNMWFLLFLINNLGIRKRVYLVYSNHLDRASTHFWNGFGPAKTEELRSCFKSRILLNNMDLNMGGQLWRAYRCNNLEELTKLSIKPASSFPYLQEVVQAHVDRFADDGDLGRPESVVEDIIKNVRKNRNYGSNYPSSVCNRYSQHDQMV